MGPDNLKVGMSGWEPYYGDRPEIPTFIYYYTFATRAWQATMKLNIGLHLSANGFQLQDLEGDPLPDPFNIPSAKSQMSILNIVQARWNKKLLEMKLRGHSFHSLQTIMKLHPS